MTQDHGVRGALAWPLFGLILVTDIVTKRVAEAGLHPDGTPVAVIGDVVRWSLVYNPGAAFGLSFGVASRWLFMALTLVALVVLRRLYRSTGRGDLARLAAIAMVAAGATGNLIDRVRMERGVVDFLDVGVGQIRWPTFNVADVAVTVGAALLAWVLWRDEPHPLTVAA
jgi:signal peptidase II